MTNSLSLILVIIAGALVAVIIPISTPLLAQLTADNTTIEVIEPSWINDSNTTVTSPTEVDNLANPRGR